MSFGGRTAGWVTAASAAVIVVLCLAGPASADSELDYGLEQHVVFRIDVVGNEAFPSDELEALLRIREPRTFHPLMLVGMADREALYQPHLLEVELKALSRYYRRGGFHQVEVLLQSVTEEPEGRGDIIVIEVREGPRTYLDELRFPGAEERVGPGLVEELRFRPGVPAPADLNDLGADIYRLQTHFWQRGHLEAEIRPEMTFHAAAADTSVLAATLAYHITAGPSYTVATIDVEGNTQTRTDLIRSRLSLEEGDLFRWSDVEESQRRLLETSLFRDVSFIPASVDPDAGTADLLIQVVERRPAFFEFGFGVGTRERIRMLAAWGHNNLFGSGQRLRLRTRNSLNYEDVQRLSDGNASPELNYRYDVIHTHPSLLWSVPLETGLYLEKETRGESGLDLATQGVSLGSRFGFGRQTVQSVALRFESVDPDIHPDAIAPLREAFDASGLRESSTHSLGWDLLDEERDDPFRPTRGNLKTVTAEVGGVLGGDNSFWKLSGSWHGYTGTPLGGTLAFRVSAGVVRPYGDSLARGADGVPYQERFFAGGVSSVRGYQERSLGPQISEAIEDSLQLASDIPLPERPARGGNYRLLTNVEWRFPVPGLRSWKVGGVAFVDGGNVWERMRDIRLRGFRWRSYPRTPDDEKATRIWDYRWSAGCGLRVDTPVGPVRMDVGFPLKRARLEYDGKVVVEDGVLWHFSLGYPF